MADSIEITYSIRLVSDGEATEVGFGTSGESNTVDEALHMLHTSIQLRDWEQESGMPEPAAVDALLAAAGRGEPTP